MAAAGRIRVGVGGWNFAPWRGVFYPDRLSQKREQEYASRHLSAIEINGTYCGSQKPESFARWPDETQADFVFSLTAPRFATNRRVLAEAGESSGTSNRMKRSNETHASTTDPDAPSTPQSFTYTLLSGDTAAFLIDNAGQLQTNAVFNFETKDTYSITVRSTDQGNLTFDKTFTINVNNVSHALV